MDALIMTAQTVLNASHISITTSNQLALGGILSHKANFKDFAGVFYFESPVM
jgi:hypothetical protein